MAEWLPLTSAIRLPHLACEEAGLPQWSQWDQEILLSQKFVRVSGPQTLWGT